LDVYKQTFEYEQPSADTYCAIGECYEKLERAKWKKLAIIIKRQSNWMRSLLMPGSGIGVTLDFEGLQF
jgi:hypothetical protein